MQHIQRSDPNKEIIWLTYLLKRKTEPKFICFLTYSFLGLSYTYFRIRQKQKEGGTYSPRDAEIIDTKFKLDQLITVADLELKDERLTRWAHSSGRTVVQRACSHDPILTYACWKCWWGSYLHRAQRSSFKGWPPSSTHFSLLFRDSLNLPNTLGSMWTSDYNVQPNPFFSWTNIFTR